MKDDELPDPDTAVPAESLQCAAELAVSYLLDGQDVKVMRLEGQARLLLTDAENAELDALIDAAVESEPVYG